MSCPNCGNEELEVLVNNGRWCIDCGTKWVMGSRADVPRRSQPAEVLELPNVHDWWWYRKDNEWNSWRVTNAGPQSHYGKGQYVRAVPPLVKPTPPDADAEWLRNWIEANPSAFNVAQLNTLRHIADRLEAKGAERE